MSSHRLQPLVAPASVAVVGASQRSGAVGNEVLVNLTRGNYRGKLYAVNPAHEQVLGIDCYPDLDALPDVPEHIIFAVGDARLESLLSEAIALGVKAATIFSTLLVEGDREPTLQNRIQRMALDAGLLLAGANGMGIYNFRENYWGSGFDTRHHDHLGSVVLLSQSGAGMSGILDCEERIDFLFAASTGQELVVGVEDHLDYVLELPETRVIGLFLETSRQPEKLVAAFEKARRKAIPIVAVKVGKTELAAQMAVSHSGALAGSDAAYQAIFDRYGVQRVRDMDELATALILFSHFWPALADKAQSETADNADSAVKGDGKRGIVALHDSGGERQLMIDLAEEAGVSFASLSKETVSTLEDLLDPGLPAVNPLDGWGTGGLDADATMTGCLTTLLADDNALCGALVHDRAPGGGVYAHYIGHLEHAREQTGKPVCLVASRQGSGSDELVTEATRRGLPVLDGVSQFLAASRCLLDYRAFQISNYSLPPALSELVSTTLRTQLAQAQIEGALGEYLSSALLGECGLTMNDSVLLHSGEDLAELVQQLHYPVVLKTAVPGIEHKSDQGGVVLPISSAAQLQSEYDSMSARLGPEALVAPLIDAAGVEMILGVSPDAQFGPLLVVGFGGVHAEVLRDVSVLSVPVSAPQVESALRKLRLFPLLNGARGADPADIAGFCEMASRLSVFADAFRNEVQEVDINPVKVGAWGVVGLDALVVLKTADAPSQPENLNVRECV